MLKKSALTESAIRPLTILTDFYNKRPKAAANAKK